MPVRIRRIVVMVVAAFHAAVLLVFVAQFDPGRFVYLQPLRGGIVLLVAISALPLLVGVTVALHRPRQDRSPWIVGGAILVGLCAACTHPLRAILVDYNLDHDVAVVAVSPDRRIEVVTATRDGDSGDYRILRLRSRAALLSRNADLPFAFVCNPADRLEVTFIDPVSISIVVPGIAYHTVKIEPDTLETTSQVDLCVGSWG